jgi:RNA polymerase sigma-70 factor, ECF subfamily
MTLQSDEFVRSTEPFRRELPSGLGGPAQDPDAPPGPAEPGIAWLEPVPDALVTPESEDPS